MTAVSESLLLLCLLTVAECDLVVFGTVGNNVTLPCKYDVTRNSLVPICWGLGAIPLSKCNNQLISTDGAKVSKYLLSSRYQLLGDLEKGNVSMTILNVSETDSGHYGCRVELVGLFNDHKNQIELRVQKATEPITFRTLDNFTSTEQTPSNYTQAAHINSTWYWNTSNPEIIFAQEERSSTSLVLLICVPFVAFIAVGGAAVYFVLQYVKFSKSSQMGVGISLSRLGPHNREENIYQMDEVNDYQYCP